MKPCNRSNKSKIQQRYQTRNTTLLFHLLFFLFLFRSEEMFKYEGIQNPPRYLQTLGLSLIFIAIVVYFVPWASTTSTTSEQAKIINCANSRVALSSCGVQPCLIFEYISLRPWHMERMVPCQGTVKYLYELRFGVIVKNLQILNTY